MPCLSAHAKLGELEARLDYRFTDAGLLRRALTHPSARERVGEDYNRLEFLGDRVLGLVLAEVLMTSYPNFRLKEHAIMLAELGSQRQCAAAARLLKLGEAIEIGADEKTRRAHELDSLLGDCCEAVIAAIYLDGGLEAARRLILTLWRTPLTTLTTLPVSADIKTQLQEWSQRRGLGVPSYRLLRCDGPAHAPDFTVTADLPGYAAATGKGKSRRDAERAAATQFFAQLDDHGRQADREAQSFVACR